MQYQVYDQADVKQCLKRLGGKGRAEVYPYAMICYFSGAIELYDRKVS